MRIEANYTNNNNVQTNDPWQALINRLQALQKAVQLWLEGDRDPTVLFEIKHGATEVEGSLQPSNPAEKALLDQIVSLGHNVLQDSGSQMEELNQSITASLQYLENPN